MDNLLVRIHCIIEMMGWTGLAPWEFKFPLPGSLTSTFLALEDHTTLGVEATNTEKTREEAMPDLTPSTVQINLSIRCIRGDIRLWVGDTSTSSCLV